MDEDIVVCAVGEGAFTTLWCALAFYKARVGVLGSGLDGFSLDGLNDDVDGEILEGLFVPCGLD